MADKKCPECPKCLPGWLVQFGDLMSLLLTFFILLLSMAVMDKKKVEEYFQIMKKAMGFLDQTQDTLKRDESTNTSKDASSDGDGTSADVSDASEEMSQLVNDINDQISTNQTEQLEIKQGKNEFTLDIPSSLMFNEGEYELTNKSAKRFISKIARVIRTMPQTFDIEIIGHTDRSNFVSNSIPRDGWDLSALRSISVVKELIKNRIDPAQLKVSAYSSYRPKSENAAENRRVEIRFVSSNDQKNILEKENFFDRLNQ